MTHSVIWWLLGVWLLASLVTAFLWSRWMRWLRGDGEPDDD